MSSDFSYPYYIIAPPYIRTSAGIRVLYRLADMINKSGGSAYIYLRPRANHYSASSPMDIAPFLTQKIIDYHYDAGKTPIVIYPETISVNKFDPPVRVRYLLNFNELLFQNEPLEKDDFILSYSKNISDNIDNSIQHLTLFLPISDHLFYCPPTNEVRRNGACYYAGKFKYKFNGKTSPITDDMIEITRDKIFSQTPAQIRTLFQNCELFYCYEDSALALEAMLCGCPTVWMPNKYFQKSLGSQEIFGLGTAWGNDSEQIEHAKRTVNMVRDRYIQLLIASNDSLLPFLEKTQSIASNKIYSKKFLLDYPIQSSSVTKFFDFINYIIDSIEDRGFVQVLKIIYKRLRMGRLIFIKS